MTFTISREKNIISFLAEGKSKSYDFDINTGILYSLADKPLKNFPSGFKTCVSEHREDDIILFTMYEMLNSTYKWNNGWSFKLADFQKPAQFLMIADRLNSIGYTRVERDKWRYSSAMLSMINEHFKDFVKYVKEEEEPTLEHFCENVYPALWAEAHGIEMNEVIDAEFIKAIMSQEWTAEQIEYLIKCIRRGVPYFYMYDDGRIDKYAFRQDLRNYMLRCEALDMKYDKDFFRGVALSKRMYQTHKAEIDNKAIEEQYKKHDFIFEDDNFIVVVPQTTDDFKNEALAMNNCVYNMYMRRVVEGSTNVVFIRKKSNPTKSYITCEVTNNGKIWQFYLANNRSVDRNSKENDFRHAYQKWLNENWA